MLSIKEQPIMNNEGRTVGFFVDIESYKNILEELEELESLRAFDTAKSDLNQEYVPFEKALKEIKQKNNV